MHENYFLFHFIISEELCIYTEAHIFNKFVCLKDATTLSLCSNVIINMMHKQT